MSRRGRHGRHAHAGQAPRPRPAGPVADRPATAAEAPAPTRPEERVALRRRPAGRRAAPPTRRAPATRPATTAARDRPRPGRAPPRRVPMRRPVAPGRAGAGRASRRPAAARRPGRRHASSPRGRPATDDGYRPTCTVAQLRRFIKSRPWIPLHELRRRFGIYGGDDDVSPIRVGDQTLFIGLPPAESRLMAELLSGGDVGYELSLDPGRADRRRRLPDAARPPGLSSTLRPGCRRGDTDRVVHPVHTSSPRRP